MESPLFQQFGTIKPRLIETLRWDGAALLRLDLHLARLAQGAAQLGYSCDLDTARAAIVAAGQGAPARLRLTMGADGRCEVTAAPLPAAAKTWTVAVAEQRLDSRDPFLRIKSTHRPAYDTARAQMPAGLDEVILLNERGEVADGSITTVFFDRGAGMRTPPLTSGALPGVLRAQLNYPEETITAKELDCVRLWVGNSLRGIIKVNYCHK